MSFQNPSPSDTLINDITHATSEIHNVISNVETVIKGKRHVIEEVFMAIVAGGHVLLKDTPGVGKTLLAKTISHSINTGFKRIQFTPDLLPTDITGVSIYNSKTKDFEFRPGPVFTNILLADEINRASPKTQSALLEAMEERQVSVDNNQYKLEKFFFVIATKNPIEHAGTYPLPTAQLDRFMMCLSLGYPSKETEIEILQQHTQHINPLERIQHVATAENVLKWQAIADHIYTSPLLDEYIVNLARASREDDGATSGVSTRAAIQLKKAARACALINRRDYMIPDDVHRVIKAVFAHRIGTRAKVGESVVEDILQKVTI